MTEWDRPSVAALRRRNSPAPYIVRTGAPERIYDEKNADPDWKPRPVGFTAKLVSEPDPVLWEGDQA